MELEGRGKLKDAGVEAIRRLDGRFLAVGRCGVYLILGFTMACARVMENGAPFGMAMVACGGPGLTGVFALAGAALGYLVSGGIEWGIRYIAAAVLIYTVSFVFQELDICRKSFFMPCCSALIMALTGFLRSYSLSAGTVPLAAELFLETALAFGGAYFFREAFGGKVRSGEADELRHSVSVMVTVGCVLMAVSRIVIMDMASVGRFLALILVMCSAMKGGMLTGAAVGTVLGMCMDAAGAPYPFYTMAYAFAGLLSGVFGRHGRVLFALTFVCSMAVAVVSVWETGLYMSVLYETAAAVLIFILLPASVHGSIALLLQCPERGSGETSLRRFVAGRVKNLSEAYGELFEIMRVSTQEPYNDENIARVFDRAADEVCVKCKYKNRCWNQNYVETLSAMNDATSAMVENGSLREEDLPMHFRDSCLSPTAFVAAVNGELRGLSYRRALRSRLNENRSVAWAQYTDIAQVLESVAGELGSINGSDPMAERRLLRFLRSMDMDADTAVYRDGGGRLRVVIECGSLAPLIKSEDYLEKLSNVVGVRLCLSGEPGEGCSRLTLLEAEPLAVSVGIAALKKRGEKVSGDKGSYFKTDAGVLCVILTDGMGSGDEAAKDSARVVSILEKFLRSGVDPAVAMKTLNSVMLLRSPESWGYVSVDLMCVDLFTGETCFYKYGAAPSYVKCGKSIRRIKGESLAAGLSLGEGIAPDLVRMRLKPGSTAVIASDGVLADDSAQWLEVLMAKGFEDMKAMARAALKEAENVYGANDDMTVVTVRVEERA